MDQHIVPLNETPETAEAHKGTVEFDITEDKIVDLIQIETLLLYGKAKVKTVPRVLGNRSPI